MDPQRVIAPMFARLRDFDGAQAALADVAGEALFRMCHPFGDLRGAEACWQACYAPLLRAMPDLERVETIRIAGCDAGGAMWVGSCGVYQGLWRAPWLGMPATGHLAQMRFHEFYRLDGDRVAEVQAIWDLPEMMMQADVWPMAPQLGRFMAAPAPQSGDGLGPHDAALSGVSERHVIAMLEAMIRHPAQGGPEVMELDRFWHPKFNWYGPCGIGTARGVDGFRRHHQIPFLRAMPDRGQYPDEAGHHFIAEGNYVGVTGWPNMVQTLSGDGWLGIAPVGQKLELRSLDFWRLEGGFIRENWVLVDLLDVWRQVGVDVLARMRERVSMPGVGD